MIYSQWQPEGVYQYYEDSTQLPLGDDLAPDPMPRPTKLGVPSVEVGRPLPRAARPVGTGQQAVGVIVPMRASAFQVSGLLQGASPEVAFAFGMVTAAGVIYLAYEYMRRTG